MLLLQMRVQGVPMGRVSLAKAKVRGREVCLSDPAPPGPPQNPTPPRAGVGKDSKARTM